MAKKCNEDCWNCELDGCPYVLYDSIELDREVEKEKCRDNANRLDDRLIARRKWLEKNKDRQKKYYTDYNHSERGRIIRAKYRKTDKYKETTRLYRESDRGKEAISKYNTSEKRKASSQKYRQSEKGKERLKRYKQTEAYKIKNREQAKKYYQAHKEEILAKRKRLRENKDVC